MNRLDHRDPLVFDTHELGRRPGSLRKVSRTAEAPAELGVADVIGVPEKSEIKLELRLESVVEGVLVTGTAEAHVTGECSRCLEPMEDDLEVDFQELYYYPESEERHRAIAGGDFDEESEDETYRLEGDLFDLQPVLRDAVVLALPLQPVCQDDCLGLCSECGARLSDDPSHHHDAADPRWAALQGLSAAPGDEGDEE
ncbi:YceD family protein [Kitasatospora sp. NPDC092948]|uniref:YceD family protein n=1 Tax=Kitasatospora sp. NPDC092948 TaxID=3364088 RepID=UPI0037F2E68D